MIEFVSYTGKFPNLCDGFLSVRVDGREVRFGVPWGMARDGVQIFPQFWRSGGCAGFTDDGDEFCCEGPWEMDGEYSKRADKYPPEIFARLPEILAVMNENVEHGCCGGCI